MTKSSFLRHLCLTIFLLVALLQGLAIADTEDTEETKSCSTYKNQVFLNEVHVGSSGNLSTSNRIELFNSANVPASVWQKWQLVVYYRSSDGTVTKKGGYYLSSGFTAVGQFIYNNDKAIYLRNRDGRYTDIALVDQYGQFIDYLAIEGKIQTLPSCMASTVVNATASDNSIGNISRLPDGGSWPGTVTNSSINTISRTNLCNAGGSDLFVSNSTDSTTSVVNPLVTVTPVTYTITVQNQSCSNTVNNIALTDTNISSANFSSLSYSKTQGSSSQGSSSVSWNIGTLAAGASATLTVTGTPMKVGLLTTTATITSPATGLINTGDDTDSENINVRDFNYVGFDIATDTLVEGTDTTYSASISSTIVASKPITINYTVSGTANSGDTDLPASGSVVINPADTNSPDAITINFIIKNDLIYEQDKTINFKITSVTSSDPVVKLDPALTTMDIALNDDDQPPTLAEYEMDEAYWNGTANEVNDDRGNFSATAAGFNAIKPTTAGASPAISGSPGTCRYGEFNRTNKDYVALPTSFPNLGANGLAFTITGWIRTTNNTLPNQRIFIDDENNTGGYGFSVADGGTGRLRFFSRGTPSALILDTDNVIASNTWYFVAAVIDVPNRTKRIYVYNVVGNQLANVAMSWTEASFGADNGIATIGGETNSASENNNSFGFAGNIDEVRVYQAALNVNDLAVARQLTRPCSTVNAAIPPANFNCTDSGENPATGHLFTKVAGSPLSFEVVALKADGSAETNFVTDLNKNVTVELVDGSDNATCANLVALTPAVTQTLSFSATDQGRKVIAPIVLSSAYPNLRCRVTDANQSSNIVGCSTDNFAVRPSGLTISSTANADAAGSNVNASPTVKTGATFTLIAASGTPGFNNAPKLDLTKIIAHTGATQTGIVTGTFMNADASTGVSSASTFTYSEVGYFKFAAEGVYDNSFTAVDLAAGDCTNDFSNVPTAGGKIGCKFGNTATTSNFGRFTPDHFDVTLNTPMFAPSCNSFTYIGNPIKFSTNPLASLTAKSMIGTTTKNYTGAFWKVIPSHAMYGINPIYIEMSQPLTVLNNSIPTATDNGDGTGSLNFADTTSNILAITRSAPISEFNAEIALSFTLQDTDAVQVANINGGAGVNPVRFGAASAGNGISFTGGNKAQRWGRLALGNAYGSEFVALSVPLFAEYFNGSSFISNTSDNCTALTLSSQLALSNPVTNSGATKAGNAVMTIAPSGTSQASLANATLLNGVAGLSFSAPGAGNTGYIDITGNFASMPWLLFDWDKNGVQDNSPTAKATFGIYKGNSKQIYLREVY